MNDRTKHGEPAAANPTAATATRSSSTTTQTPTATASSTTPAARRTTSWSNIVALEGDAARVVTGNRPLPDSARDLVDVAQKARKGTRAS
jgi:hypothetical protein